MGFHRSRGLQNASIKIVSAVVFLNECKIQDKATMADSLRKEGVVDIKKSRWHFDILRFADCSSFGPSWLPLQSGGTSTRLPLQSGQSEQPGNLGNPYNLFQTLRLTAAPGVNQILHFAHFLWSIAALPCLMLGGWGGSLIQLEWSVLPLHS